MRRRTLGGPTCYYCVTDGARSKKSRRATAQLPQKCPSYSDFGAWLSNADLCRPARARRATEFEVSRNLQGTWLQSAGAGRGGNSTAWRDGGMPASRAFIVHQAQFLLQLLVIPQSRSGAWPVGLTASAWLRRALGNPVFHWLRFSARPLDERPVFPVRLRLPILSMRGPDANRSEPRRQLPLRSIAPSDICPSGVRQRERALLRRHGLVVPIPARQLR